MNSRGESLYLPNDLAVQKARKDGYSKGWDDMRILDERVMQDALWESVTYRELSGNRDPNRQKWERSLNEQV